MLHPFKYRIDSWIKIDQTRIVGTNNYSSLNDYFQLPDKQILPPKNNYNHKHEENINFSIHKTFINKIN